MNPTVSGPRLRRTGLGALAAAILMLATACGGSSHPAAATTSTGIQPGSGQSLAGAPGATATGPAGDAGAASSMGTMAMTAPTSAAAGAPVAGNAVQITGFAFAPAALTVKAGTTVTWTNKDADAHTVTSQGSGGPLQSAALSTGQTFSYTFTTPGTYAYLCTIHPFMTATVTVTE